MHTRIEIRRDICHGKPCIRGTRIMVANILSLPAGGYDVARVLKNYPELTEADVLAALDYAGDVVHDEEVLAPALGTACHLFCDQNVMVAHELHGFPVKFLSRRAVRQAHGEDAGARMDRLDR